MNDDPLLNALAQLPKRDVDDLTGERIRRRARAVAVEESSRPRWLRLFEPAAVAVVVMVYAGWAIGAASSLFTP